jgi:hypothetical protein
MAIITFELTELEAKVMANTCADVQDWIENATKHQIELAKDRIVEREKIRMLADPNCLTMPSDRNQICAQADLTPLAQQGGN